MDKNIKRVLSAQVIDHAIDKLLHGENISQSESKELIEFCKAIYSMRLMDEKED